MKIIGITGGIGAGKTQVLSYIEKHSKSRIILADETAHKLKEPGQVCYGELVRLLGVKILNMDGAIDNGKMAAQVFGNESMLKEVNRIVHPAVKDYISSAIEEERAADILDFLWIEAALLIECGYEQIVDELWYIYADRDTRRRRLKDGRQYTDEKIDRIFASQLSEEDFRKHCSVVIDNSRDLAYVYDQIDRKLGEYLWKR